MRGSARVDEPAQACVDLHDLEDAESALEPAVVALTATLSLAEWSALGRVKPRVEQHVLGGVVICGACSADLAGEPLCDDALERP